MATTGCGSESSPSDAGVADACPLGLEVGRETGAGTFVAYTDGEDAEIVVGFQGFLFLDVALRLSGTSAETARVTVQVDVEGLDTSWVSQTVALQGDAKTGHAAHVRVLFSAPSVNELVDRPATLTFGLAADGCVGQREANLILVDVDRCIHQGDDGGFSCPDGG